MWLQRLPLPRLVGTSARIPGHMRDLASAVPKLGRYLRHSEAALVHGQDGRTNLSWCLPSQLAHCPYVWHQRSAYQPSRLAWILRAFASHTVCISRFVAESFPGARPQTVVVNPFETESIARNEKRREILATESLPAETPIIGFVGNMRAHKRPFQFVEVAAALAKSSAAPLVFAMFGADQDGLLADVRKSVIDAGVDDSFRFMDFRYPISAWVASCDLLLVPSIGEAFGRTLVEAMVAGTPVVASDSGGHGEIIEQGETGFLVPSDDVPAMKDAAARLLDDRALWRATADTAKARAMAHYSVARHASAMMNIYDALLDRE